MADFFSSFTMGLVLSASFGRKRAMVVNLPTNLCTSLTLLGLRMSMIVWHFSRLALMPRLVNMNPRNLPPSTLKVHFFGLRRKLYFGMALKTLVRSRACWVGLGDLTTMSSTYTSTLFRSSGFNEGMTTSLEAPSRRITRSMSRGESSIPSPLSLFCITLV